MTIKNRSRAIRVLPACPAAEQSPTTGRVKQTINRSRPAWLTAEEAEADLFSLQTPDHHRLPGVRGETVKSRGILHIIKRGKMLSNISRSSSSFPDPASGRAIIARSTPQARTAARSAGQEPEANIWVDGIGEERMATGLSPVWGCASSSRIIAVDSSPV